MRSVSCLVEIHFTSDTLDVWAYLETTRLPNIGGRLNKEDISLYRSLGPG